MPNVILDTSGGDPSTGGGLAGAAAPATACRLRRCFRRECRPRTSSSRFWAGNGGNQKAGHSRIIE